MDVDESKIHPIHLGLDQTRNIPDPADVADALHRVKVDKPYILTVGTLEPRKNIPFLVEVFEKLTDFKGTLVIAGAPGWKYEPILERISQSPRASDIRYLKYVDDRTLTALYTGAELFVTTSVYEGFGLPPLEAMACGTPVVSSAGGSLPEVLGSAALIVNDFDHREWKHNIQKMLQDGDLRGKMTEVGKEHVKQYNWDRTAPTYMGRLQEPCVMKIVIDARWIFPEISGIGAYTRELIKELALIDQENDYVLLFNDGKVMDRTVRETGTADKLNFRTELLPYGLFSIKNQVLLPRLLKELQADVYHSTNYMIPLPAFPPNKQGTTRCITTIHDVIPMIFPNHAPKSRKAKIYPVYKRLMIEIGKRADTIITDSKASAAEHHKTPANRKTARRESQARLLRSLQRCTGLRKKRPTHHAESFT